MDKIINFVISNWENILLIIVVLVGCYLAYFKFHKEKEVKQFLYFLVAKAEKEWGSKTGQIKYQQVLDEFYSHLPSIMKIFLSKKTIDYWIHEAVEMLKDWLSKPGNNLDGDYIGALDFSNPNLEIK